MGPVCLPNLALHQPLRNVKWLVQMRNIFPYQTVFCTSGQSGASWEYQRFLRGQQGHQKGNISKKYRVLNWSDDYYIWCHTDHFLGWPETGSFFFLQKLDLNFQKWQKWKTKSKSFKLSSGVLFSQCKTFHLDKSDPSQGFQRQDNLAGSAMTLLLHLVLFSPPSHLKSGCRVSTNERHFEK